ncbi:DNA polymerase III subunit delta [Vibrio profundum]|uniref:DNA polymerase III subunit delta n=1 Tax=Vibrio profundum TaxID=2910247 RepID=UPI003D1430C1
MRLYADRLASQLKQHLASVYLVFGNEPLLIDESLTQIRQTAEQHDFSEQHKFVISDKMDWSPLYDCCQSMSLFSSRQIIELSLPEAGVTAAIAKELVQFGEQLHNDLLVIIVGHKLTKAQEKAKWFTGLLNQGCWISCLTPDIERLPQFVRARCQTLGLKPDAEACQMLAQWHEGNLSALAQSLEKLALLYPDGNLNLVRLEESLSRHNHFTAFHWVDALLAGKANRCQRILRQLQSEGTEPIVLLRTIQKELMQLTSMSDEMQQGSPISQVMNQYKVWQSKRPQYTAALSRLSQRQLTQAMTLLAQAERLTKTSFDTSPWPLLQQLSLQLCYAERELAPLFQSY